MPEMSGKCISNPTKPNNLIYIMIFFKGGGEILGGGKKIKKITPPFLIYTPGFEQKKLQGYMVEF